MVRRFDAIVVGAGLGGLSAATYLAKSGLGVCLLERHNVPGGYATSFVRGRYEFEVALHALSGIGRPDSPGPLYRYLEWLGVAQKLEFTHTPHIYSSWFPDMRVDLPMGWEAYEAKLVEYFPKEAQGIGRFLDRVRKVCVERSAFEKDHGMRLELKPSVLAKLPARYPNLLRYMFSTWLEVLRRDIRDPRARAVISQYWGYFGLPPREVSFFYFALGLGGYLKHGVAFPRGRSQALSSAMAARFQELGGELHLGCGASRILTEDGKVVGVRTEDGEELKATQVVSNADPFATCFELLGREAVPAGHLEQLKVRRPSWSTFNVYLGVNRSPDALGLTAHECFMNQDADFEAQYRSSSGLEAPQSCLVTCYNRVLPDISPPGTSQVVLVGGSQWKPWSAVAPEAYVETKNRLADCLLRMAEKLAPDLRRYTEVVEVSTPLTNVRFEGAMAGAVYGFENTPWDHTIWRMAPRGPVKGLTYAGAWTMPGGGFEPCMLSGRNAGSMIVQRMKHQHGEA